MVGLSVVLQTLCKIVVFPAFALPMMRTRNWIVGIGRGCFVSIAFVSIGERRATESGIDLKRLQVGSNAQVHTLIKQSVIVIVVDSSIHQFHPSGSLLTLST